MTSWNARSASASYLVVAAVVLSPLGGLHRVFTLGTEKEESVRAVPLMARGCTCSLQAIKFRPVAPKVLLASESSTDDSFSFSSGEQNLGFSLSPGAAFVI